METIYMDTFTGTKSHRPERDKLLKDIKGGDMLIVTKLDHIARSTMQGIELIEELVGKGVIIHVLNIGIMDHSPTGKLIRNISVSSLQRAKRRVKRLILWKSGDFNM